MSRRLQDPSRYADHFSEAQSASRPFPTSNLVLLQTVFPDCRIGCDTILAEVDHDIHRVLLHRLALVEIEIIEVGHDLLDCRWGGRLELLHLVLLARRGKHVHDLLAVLCDERCGQ